MNPLQYPSDNGLAYPEAADALHGELHERFTYHAPRADQLPRYEALRTAYGRLARLLVGTVPQSRELDQALAHLETSSFYGNAGIARREKERPTFARDSPGKGPAPDSDEQPPP